MRSAAKVAAGSISGNVALISAGAGNQTVAVTAIVKSTVTPSLMIAASGTIICAGPPVTFKATPTNGGNSPVYQWLLNGSNTGENSPTYSSTFPNGDLVSCVMTGSMPCTLPRT